jgi:hypothetical protein
VGLAQAVPIEGDDGNLTIEANMFRSPIAVSQDDASRRKHV